MKCIVVSLLSVVACYPYDDKSISIGCLLWHYVSPNADTIVPNATTVPTCKAACASQDGCTAWSLLAGGVCKVGTGDRYGSELVNIVDSVSGPPECDFPAKACKEGISGTFPGNTNLESMQAWDDKFQPMPLQCWEMDSTGKPMKCDEIQTVEDTTAIGHCDGLILKTLAELPGNMSCEEYCRSNPECPVWNKLDNGACYVGTKAHPGTNCWSRSNTPGVSSGARYIRGTYRLLKKFDNERVQGLNNVFVKEDSDKLTEAGRVPANTCRDHCLSALGCQYWQLLENSGCWIQLDRGAGQPDVHYPLISSNLEAENAADRVLDGEYLQRYCQAQFDACPGVGLGGIGGAIKKAHLHMKNSGWPWWAWWLLLALLLCCCLPLCIGACLYAMGCCSQKKAQKKKRAIKPAPVETQTREVTVPQPTSTVYTVPQPVQTFTTQMPVYQAAPVYAAQPPVVSTAAPVYVSQAQQVVAPQAQQFVTAAPLQVAQGSSVAMPVQMAQQGSVIVS